MKPPITRRSATEEDIPFLLDLRRKTMNPHLAASGASTSESDHMQRLMGAFECAEVLLLDGQPIGLLKVRRTDTEWKIIQIQLAPEVQGKGLGAQVLGELITQADAEHKALTLSVLKANPAKSLYERLGFAIEDESEFEFNMRRARR